MVDLVAAEVDLAGGVDTDFSQMFFWRWRFLPLLEENVRLH